MTSAKKILLVQLYSNGDCLYATAVARQIKKDFPGSHLTWAIASFCKNIIANNPYVDAIMEVDDTPKNDVAAFRRFRKRVYELRQQDKFSEVFITHNMDTNHAYYDGCIRSSILKAYPFPVTVPVTPVLRLTEKEIENVRQFVLQHKLKRYKQVILFEFAPLSGQLKIIREIAIAIADDIVTAGDTAVILSSGSKVLHDNEAVIDGSVLSLRETAALTHYCTLLLGCSSGITWISTSDAAKQLPMIQLLNAKTTWVNPVSRDFERFNLPVQNVIELLEIDKEKIVNCVKLAVQNFGEAKNKYNQPVPLHFKTTRSIIYNLLCYLEFKAIARHIKINRKVYGNNFSFYKEVLTGFIIAPFTLIRNLSVKNLGRKMK
jgi:ADP-heptose:LPS heptosyltransferase